MEKEFVRAEKEVRHRGRTLWRTPRSDPTGTVIRRPNGADASMLYGGRGGRRTRSGNRNSVDMRPDKCAKSNQLTVVKSLARGTLSMAMKESLKEAVRGVVSAQNADVLIFNSSIERPGDRLLIKDCQDRKFRPNLFMMLLTAGGDPDAAYRISRTLQNHYEKFVCCIPGVCKSAGTLILLGAQELVFSEHGEIGPLDIQMAKKDDLWESESGLTVMTALSALHQNAQEAFDHFLVSLTTQSGGRVTMRTASEVAAKLTEALYAPISAQIDPIHMGEVYRSMSIADHYGKRLIAKGKNCDNGALRRLISDYPSHGFVIDSAEASNLFKNVRHCNQDELTLLAELGSMARILSDTPLVKFISDEIEDQPSVNEKNVLERPGIEGPPAAAAENVPGNNNGAAPEAAIPAAG